MKPIGLGACMLAIMHAGCTGPPTWFGGAPVGAQGASDFVLLGEASDLFTPGGLDIQVSGTMFADEGGTVEYGLKSATLDIIAGNTVHQGRVLEDPTRFELAAITATIRADPGLRTVALWAAFTYEGDVMPFHFYHQDLKIVGDGESAHVVDGLENEPEQRQAGETDIVEVGDGLAVTPDASFSSYTAAYTNNQSQVFVGWMYASFVDYRGDFMEGGYPQPQQIEAITVQPGETIQFTFDRPAWKDGSNFAIDQIRVNPHPSGYASAEEILRLHLVDGVIEIFTQ